MRKIFFILTLTLFFASLSSSFAQGTYAGKKKCENTKVNPQVEFTTSYGKLIYDFKKSQKELTSLGGKYGIVEKGMFASGLATIDVNWEISLNTVSKSVGNNDICVVPMSVNIYIGYTDPIIYVSKDLKPDSCMYNVVVRHEQTHQQINKSALEYFIPLLRDASIEIVKKVKPIHITSRNQMDRASEQLTENYITELKPLVDYFKQELMHEQGKLDNHKNYQLEGDLCKNFNNTH